MFKLCLLSILLTAAPQEEVKQIDQQIDQLTELQDKYRASAKRHANNAMRWQFQSENYLDARKAWDLASRDKQKAEEIQKQIDALKEKRSQLAKE